MRQGALLIVALAALPAAAQELEQFDGRYLASPTSDCSLGVRKGGAIEIAKGVFTGVGAKCDMSKPVNVRDMEATLFDLDCTDEDREWNARAMLMRAADDGLIVVWDGYAQKYDRCPDNPAAGTVTRADDIGILDGKD